MQGKKINTLHALMEAVIEKKSVIALGTMWLKKPCPAAVVINFQGGAIWSLFNSGLYVYKKTAKKTVKSKSRQMTKARGIKPLTVR
jgi:hypothetical protein